MLMTPVRAAPEFAATLNATAPLPEPLAPEVTVTHAAPLLAVQLQPPLAVTVTEPLPPAAAIDASGGLIAEVQGAEAAA